MNTDEWLIQQVIAHNLISPEKLKEVQEMKKTTDLSYEAIILQMKLLEPQQIAMIKNSPLKKKASVIENTSVAKKSQSLSASNTFGRYLIEKKLGEGSFGTVFLAYDSEWNRKVAIKILKPGFCDDELTVKRFKREVDAIAQLNHPGIIKVYEFGQVKEQVFYTMSYIEGETLEDILKRDKKISSRKAARLIKSIAEILQHAHEHNLIHRDIKPENIMIAIDGQVYLTDFGLAKNTQGSKLSRTGEIMGTPSYMSPEQARGKKIDKQSDIYSLGATLYELLTGQVPFPGNNTTKILIDIMQKKPISLSAINPNISVDLEKICLKCLEKSKEQRYENVEKLIHDIDLFLDGKMIYSAGVSKKTMMMLVISFIITILIIIFLFVENRLLKQKIQGLDTQISKNKKDIEELEKFGKIKKDTITEIVGKFERNIALSEKIEELTTDYEKASHVSLKVAILKKIKEIKPYPLEFDIYKNFNQEYADEYEKYNKAILKVTFFNGHYYAAFGDKKTWSEAREYCAKLNGNLVACETLGEHKYICEFVENLKWETFWIGLYQPSGDHWHWITTGEQYIYDEWGEEEPNNSGGKEDYVEIRHKDKWNDQKNDNQNYYICEWELE